MKISIITVSLNNVSTIEHTVLSVLNQDYKNIEYIIIDGGSKDGTQDILKKYSHQVSKIVSEKDKGIYYALNKGIKLATGEIVSWLHADDIYCDEKVISKIVNRFEKSGSDAVYSDLVYIKQTNPDAIFRHWKSGRYKPGSFVNGWMPPHTTLFVKRELFDRFGYYNTSLTISADYELMLRMIHKHGISISYIPEVTVKMRIGGKSNTSIKNRLLANREDRLAWKINGLRSKIFTTILKPLRKIGQFI